MPDLTDRDRERFEQLREHLADVERRTDPGREPLTEPTPLDPMLAESFEGDLGNLEESEWYAERKYDGTRILLQTIGGSVSLFTRRHIDRAAAVPSITEAAADRLPAGLVLDGEVTFFDETGGSQFVPIHTAPEKRNSLTLRFVAFDVLVHDGEWVLRRPLSERKELLESVLTEEDPLTMATPQTNDLEAYYHSLIEADEEGIVLKRRDSPYHLGTRSRHWQKVKAVEEVDLLAVGYTAGSGRRSATFGALVLADPEGYVGRVGSGFTESALERVTEAFEEADDRRVPRSAVGESYEPIEPLVVTVRFQAVTDSRKLRAPVFERLRPEKPPTDVEPIEQQLV